MYKYLLKTPLKRVWKKVNLRRKAGIIAPLFSVFSKKSIGIGEIPDLKLLIDWCNITGNTILQVLPLNDTGFDFSPYNPQSSFALDPIYLSLRELYFIKKENLEKELKDLVVRFPVNTKYVNYKIKREKLKKLFSIFLKRAIFPKEFQQFIKKNNYWLQEYCLFKVLKEIYEEKSWEEWPQKIKNLDRKVLKKITQKNKDKIKFQQWLQWQLFKQLRKIKKYADGSSIFLKGDLPFSISRDSADVWSWRQYFKLDLASGAPPDLFSIKGQRWGYPPYNWNNILKDNFVYIGKKLKYAQNFYDFFRIDHVVGIFRIWSIPIDTPFNKQGMVGFFYPLDEKKWEERGRKILKLIIKNTKMLPCAEDLGTVPKFCSKVLREFGIPGLDLQRWNKDWQYFEFLKPKEYRSITVATISTHDLNNFPAWWEEEAGKVPEEVFKRKCQKKGIKFEKIKKILFFSNKYQKGKLFWKKGINKNKFIHIVGRPKKEILDLLQIYKESYREKEKFRKLISKKVKFTKKAGKEIIESNLKLINSVNSIFVILPIFEWLFVSDILKDNFSQYRINIPSKVSKKNWSLRLPLFLEDLINHPINIKIIEIIQKTDRIP